MMGATDFEALWPLIDKVPGYLIPGQERWLFNAVRQLPDDAVIVEVGSFLGRSTTAMALACRGTNRRIHAIDTFKGNDSDFVNGANNVSWEGNDYLETFKNNLKEAGVLEYVIPHQGLSNEIGATWSKPIDFAFIDGSHVYEDVLTDFETFFPFLKPGALMAFHDVLPDWDGPYRAWYDHIRDRLEHSGLFFSIGFGRKAHDARSIDNKVHIIIPVHNRRSITQGCLKQIVAQSLIKKITITVVDDGSTDGTSNMLANDFPQVNVIRGDGNLWWTGGVAKALEQLKPTFAKGDYFLLINNDSRLSSDSVEMLVHEAEARGRAGIAPIALSGAQAISTGWGPGTAPILNNFEAQFAELAKRGNSVEVHTLFGRCSLFPVEILDAIGNYDPAAFPHYYGDSDFCLRARKAGFLFYVTGATCIRVIEDAKSTGSHYAFRQGPQRLRSVIRNMFSIKSIDNIPATWRYMLRHYPHRATRNTLGIAWRSLRQWWPIYIGIGLTPLPEPGAARARDRIWWMKYFAKRIVFYFLHPVVALQKAVDVVFKRGRRAM